MNVKMENALHVVALSFGGVALFSQWLELGPWLVITLCVAAAAAYSFLFALRARRRRKEAFPSSKGAQSIRLTVLVLSVLGVTTLSGIWWLPFMGLRLSLAERLIVSVIACVFGISIYLLGSRNSRRKQKEVAGSAEK